MPPVLACIDEQYLVQHGQLTFVDNMQVGRKLAREHGLPYLFFLTAEWCTNCDRMSESAFAAGTFGHLGKHFVCVLVDADRERSLCQNPVVTGYPTVEFVSPHGQSLHRLVGQQSPANRAAGMQAALMRSAWITSSVVRQGCANSRLSRMNCREAPAATCHIPILAGYSRHSSPEVSHRRKLRALQVKPIG